MEIYHENKYVLVAAEEMPIFRGIVQNKLEEEIVITDDLTGEEYSLAPEDWFVFELTWLGRNMVRRFSDGLLKYTGRDRKRRKTFHLECKPIDREQKQEHEILLWANTKGLI